MCVGVHVVNASWELSVQKAAACPSGASSHTSSERCSSLGGDAPMMLRRPIIMHDTMQSVSKPLTANHNQTQTFA